MRGAIAAELGIGLVSAAVGLTLLGASARLIAPPATGPAEPVRSADPGPSGSAAEAPANEPPAELGAEGSGEAPEPPVREPSEVELGTRFDDDSALPKPPPPIASYTLHARLDELTHTIFGKGTIRWVNATSRPADELWLHLYLNAFKNERTLFLRSRFVAGRGGQRPRDFGYLDVKKLVARELGGVDVWPRAEPHTPGDREDQTDIRVPLPGSIEPGQLLTLDVEFEAKLPTLIERTGFAESFHFAAQWFPKLARREPDGTWVHFPFHPHSEFYADYGRYSVTIDVPENMVVGATGRRVEERVASGRRSVRHELDSIHDFAFTAWDRFQEHDERIDGVDVRVLFPPGHERNLRATLEAVRFGLPHFGRRYGRYPYPVLTVVHPPEVGKQAGGMEYPSLITTGGRWFASYLRVRTVESVTLHELGHQWFYGLLATDEHRWPFLDEGVNTYAEGVAAGERWGKGSLVSWPGLDLSLPAAYRAYAVARGRDELVGQPASAFSSIDNLGALVYARTATIFQTLGNVYGEDKLSRALGRYARRFRFSHPRPEHLLRAVREVMGSEAEEGLRAALFERAWVDYLVREIEAVPANEPAGLFDEDAGRKLKPFDELAERRPARWASRAVIHRHGGLRFPVEIELEFEDGSSVRKPWDGQGDFIAVDHEGPSPIVRATVDPDHRVTIDNELINNVRSRSSSGAPRTLERATYAAELLLGWLGP